MARLKKGFPQGIDYDIVYDPTRFVQSSIEKVVHTLFEAIALVVVVMFVFLQSWRAVLIPLVGFLPPEDPRVRATVSWCSSSLK